MNKMISKILSFIMIINAIFLNVVPVFGAPKIQPRATDGATGFEWNTQAILNEKLEIIERPSDSQEVLLTWDLDKLNGKPIDNINYTLEYAIADNKGIELVVSKKNNDGIEIEYKVNKDSTVNKKDKILSVYKDGNYVNANKNILPSGVELSEAYKDGSTKKVKFKIQKNSGLSFKYQNTTIKIQYDKNGKLNFVTDGIERGIIYPFRLSYNNGTQKYIDKKIFTGLNISKVSPFANANANGNDKGKDTIDQTQNKNEFPGGDVVGVDITFDFPKDWNMIKKTFEVDSTKKPVKAVFSIGHLEESKKIQISIEDIYKNGNGSNIKVVNKDGSTSKITASYSTNTDKATITLKNLESSTMYSDVSVSAERSTDPFETIAAIYPVGTVYTYPAYRVIALGVKEYYLEIEPFRGYNGFYVISKGDLSSSMSKWSTYEDKKNGKSKILISLPLNALTEQEKYFKVNFSFTPPDLTTNDFKFTSQILKFKPSKDDIVLSTPKNFKIVESNIVKGDDGKENLFLSLKWDIDYESVLEYLIDKNGTNGTGSTGKTLDITYNFSQGLVPEEIDTSFASVKLNLTKNGSLNQNGKDKIDIKYENAGSTSGTNSITIVESKCRTTTRVETSANEVNKIYEANVTFKIPVSQRNSGTKDVLQYPNTYFVAVKGEHKINGGNQPYITGDSLPVTLTLDGITNIEIATPQNLNVLKDSIDKNEFAMQYDTLNYKEEGDALYSYNEIMLKTLGKEMNDNSVKYDFYITQRKDLLDKMTEAGTEEKLDPTVKNKIKTVEYSKVTTLNTQSGDPAKYTFDFSGNQEMLTHLRSDGIVQITNIPQNFETLDTGKINPKQELSFKGFDENQTYYIIARTGVTPVAQTPSQPAPQPPAPPAPAPTPPTTLKEEFSRFSKIVSVTTIDKTQKPTDNEKVPPAPINFKAEDISLNSANLVWDRVIENISEEETGASGNGKSGKADDKADTTPKEPSSYLEYQFIKVPKQQLSDEFLKSKNSFEKTWQDLSDVKEKYGLQTSKDKILEFNKDSKKFEETKSERYQYLLPDGKQGKIADKILSPNEIYFYYIRTVRMAKPQGQSSSSSYEPVAYSVWVPLSFTTKNVTPPVNLRVEPNAKYNKENEVVISFDIPKMNHDLIGKEYDIQYSIKEDLGEWTADKTMPVNDITIVDNVDGKTMKVTYKITGLKSGKIYTIRVRLFNKLLNISSMYSNEVEHRTDSNNGDNDYDQTVGNWNDNFKEKIEQLKNQSYWYIKDTSKETIVYYRPQYFDTIANAANGSLIPLVSGSGGAYKEYYLSASTLVKAFDQGKGFKISYKTSEVILSPKFLNTEANETIKNLKQELNKKGSGTKDYFVKVIIEFKDGKYVINGLDSLSPVAKININIVTTKDTIAEFDQKMYTYINEMLSTTEFSTDIKTAIGNLIIKNKTNAEMVVEVEKMVDRFKTKFGDRLSKEMSNLVIKTIPLKYVDSDIIVTYPVASGINGLGYKKSGSNWVSADTRDYLGKKAIFTREAGEYIFAGKKLVINGLGNLSNSEQITNVVIKYGLDDYLGKNSNINIKAPMTRNMTIGCLARLAGATKTQNPIEFFKSKGIVISTRNEDSNISQEEAVYLIMKVYEIKTGTKMDTIKIKNYNQTSGIKNINKNYKKAVQVAFQTGIYNNPNMNAKGTLSTQDFLTSITKMATMLGM